jgi:hypothetical protein
MLFCEKIYFNQNHNQAETDFKISKFQIFKKKKSTKKNEKTRKDHGTDTRGPIPGSKSLFSLYILGNQLNFYLSFCLNVDYLALVLKIVAILFVLIQLKIQFKNTSKVVNCFVGFIFYMFIN